jgi:hypothetical protein
MWVVAELDDDYIAKMEDVLERYEQPYDPQQLVVCLDEKPVTLQADVRPPSPAQPGREARRDNEYERCGTANLFCAVEPKTGRHFTFPTPIVRALNSLRLPSPWHWPTRQPTRFNLVMDHLNIHRQKSVADVFGAEMAAEVGDRFTLHYTLHTAAGSIKRRSKSGSSRGNVSAIDQSLAWKPFSAKPGPGIGG